MIVIFKSDQVLYFIKKNEKWHKEELCFYLKLKLYNNVFFGRHIWQLNGLNFLDTIYFKYCS